MVDIHELIDIQIENKIHHQNMFILRCYDIICSQTLNDDVDIPFIENYFHCHKCGFRYVDSVLSIENLKNMEDSRHECLRSLQNRK